MSIHFGNPNGIEDIRQILNLQKANLPANISSQESKEQGFVTVQHTENLLTSMNDAAPQIIAQDNGLVVGYALVMLAEFGKDIPVLVPMFEQLEQLFYQGQSVANYKYYVVGQVCVAKSHRGQGVFDGLYQQHRRQMSSNHDFVVTEIATRNQRSLRAHARVGFKTIHSYQAPNSEDWEIVLWDWK